MALETQTNEMKNRSKYLKEEDNPEIEVEVDLEGEVICALNEIERPRNKK
jgi:hypothetical protein